MGVTLFVVPAALGIRRLLMALMEEEGRVDLGGRELPVKDELVVRAAVEVVRGRGNQIEAEFLQTVQDSTELALRLGGSGAALNEAPSP